MAPEFPEAGCKPRYEPVAIIGLGCRLPGEASNPESFWGLLKGGRGAWSKIPEARFNPKAFHHADPSHHGTSHVKGGHFLSQDILGFDNTFFHLNGEVAAATDPQLRLQLETTYEAFEDAGLRIEDVAGSQTSVFAGAFHRDYHDSLMKDPDNLPRNMMVGSGTSMLANRISHFFDLHGPSLTTDTGCSTSLVILHIACQSLQTGDSVTAVVTAGNVMLGPEPFISMSGAGLLSEDGRCFSFDSRASGYGRGEGAVTLLLKLESQAIADGDQIRAVIRSTGLNQDGRTSTVTSPSQMAQESLIRECYVKAGLDPSETDYVECHGTGTQVGDLTEAGAIRNAFHSEARSSQNLDPLYIGSVKSNIGHLEAAAGLAGIVKVVQAFRNDRLPPNHDFRKPNPKIPFNEWGLQVLQEGKNWPRTFKRASVNSFGYGGTNGHAVLEAPGPCLSSKSEPLIEAVCSHVFVTSGHDTKTCEAVTTRVERYITSSRPAMQDLAYTLGSRRSKLPFRQAFRASRIDELGGKLRDRKANPIKASSALLPIGFVFTGQGAQWQGMGKELIDRYPVFKKAIEESDECISSLGASWSIMEELFKGEAESKVDKAEISMPICCALQIALVCLLRSWNIHPLAVTGHSSGESAAAFAAGALDMRSALAVQYYRGWLTGRLTADGSIKGSMMAVGLGPADITPYIERVTSGKVVVGCHNSPQSVTLSGDDAAIRELETTLMADNVFVRKLNVETAFHSDHMTRDAPEYLAYLQNCFGMPQHPSVAHLSSSVTGGWCNEASDFGPSHWLDYMLQPVQFADALSKLCIERPWDAAFKQGQKSVDVLIEVGPHGALAAPIRQTLQADQLKDHSITYMSTLKRSENAVHSMQDLACLLWTRGYPVDLRAVNATNVQCTAPRFLSNLPSYPWHRQSHFRSESSISKAYRLRHLGPDDQIGVLDTNCDLSNPSWTNIVRSGSLMASGENPCTESTYRAMASRAIENLVALQGKDEILPAMNPRFRHVEIHQDLQMNDAQHMITIHTALRRSKFGPDPVAETWRIFSISSEDSSGMWTLHCDGLVGIVAEPRTVPNASQSVELRTERSLRSCSGRSSSSRRPKAFIWEQYKHFLSDGETKLREDYELAALVFMHDALQDLQSNPPKRMLPHHRAYCKLIMSMVDKAWSCSISNKKRDWLGMPTSEKTELKHRVRVGSLYGQAVSCIGQQLSSILRAMADPAELLSRDNFTGDIFDDMSNQRSLMQMQAVFGEIVQTDPRIRIIQIAAGAGRATKVLLEALSEKRSVSTEFNAQLVVTDESPHRLEALRSQFGAYGALVGFHQLDITKPPSTQSFENGPFDLVLAHQTLSLSKDVKTVVGNISRLLKPQGKLLFVETTTPSPDATLYMALRPSWYIGSEPDRKLNPYFSVEQWNNLLQQVGFGGVDNKLMDCESPEHHTSHLMQATKLDGSIKMKREPAVCSQASLFTQRWYTDVDLTPKAEIQKLLYNRVTPRTDVLPVSSLEYVSLVYMSSLLSSLQSESGINDQLGGHWKLYLEWIKTCVNQCSLLSAETANINATLEAARQEIALSESGSTTLRMIDRIGKNLREIFAKEVEPLQVMLEGDLLHEFYRCAFGLSANSNVAEYISLVADTQPGLSILEIGAGTGGTTYEILNRLRNTDGTSKVGRYCFTDVSPGFLAKAANRFAKDVSIMEFGTLNVERDPIEQGFELQQFDIVIAANVIHATSNLGVALRHCQSLLKTNGKLVLGEITERCLYAGFIMGSLPGWWLGEDDGRSGGPLLDIPRWDIALKKAGFSGVDVNVRGDHEESQEPMSLIVSTKRAVATSNGKSLSNYVIVTGETPLCITLAHYLRQSLGTHSSDTSIVTWSNFTIDDLESKYCISLVEWSAPMLSKITRQDWTRMRTILYRSSECLWVIGGAAMDVNHPMSSLMIGLARAIRHERGDLALATLSIEPAYSVDLFASATTITKVVTARSQGDVNDKEFATRDSLIYVPRVERASMNFPVHQDPTAYASNKILSNATYLIAGIGGIGREICRWLATRGARHLVLLSRTATSSTANKRCVEDLYTSYGTTAHLLDCDMADLTALQTTLRKVQHLPAIRGVINTAMMMKDALFEKMTPDDFHLAIRPKVHGTMNLHKLLPKDLDFFVMLSSLAGVIGYRGTGNYASACAFQDAFASFRQSLGRRAMTIDISYLQDVGFAAERSEYAGYVRALGMQAMSISDLHDMLDIALDGDHPAQVMFGLPTDQPQPGWYWLKDRRFAGLTKVVEVASRPAAAAAAVAQTFKGKLSSCTDLDGAAKVVAEALKERLANLMMISVADVDVNERLSVYGVDSLVAVELRGWIVKEMSVQISVADIAAEEALMALAMKLAVRVQGLK